MRALDNMLPALTTNNPPDRWLVNSVAVCQLLKRVCRCANLADVRVGEYRPMVALAVNSASSLAVHILGVLGLCAQKQVSVIDAGGIVAPMADHHASGNRPVHELPCGPMRQNALAAIGNAPIAGLIRLSDPDPARFGIRELFQVRGDSSQVVRAFAMSTTDARTITRRLSLKCLAAAFADVSKLLSSHVTSVGSVVRADTLLITACRPAYCTSVGAH